MAATGARSSAIMAAGTLVSRVLGFVKALLIATAIGAQTTGDIFQLANQLPNLIYVLVAGGVFNAVLVPQIIKAAKNPDGGADYISRLLSLAVIGLAVLTTVVVLLARPIITLVSTGWTQDQIDFGVTFALWCFPQLFFYGLYTVVGQILNARGAFGAYMWAPALNNVVAIAALLVFIWMFGSNATADHSLGNWTGAQTFWLAGMATVGVAAQALILFIPLKRLRLGLGVKVGWRGIGLSTAARIASWTLATGIIANLSFLFLTKVASSATGAREAVVEATGQAVAGPALLEYSTMLYQLPHGVIGLSIATVLFNRMAHSAGERDHGGMVASLSQGLRVASVATIFCAVALIVYAGPVGMMFSGGEQGAGAVMGQLVTVIALGGPFLTIAFMMGRMFYASEDARTPLVVQVISAIITIALGALVLAVVPPQYTTFYVAGLYVFMNIFSAALYHRALKRWLGDYDVAHIVKTHLRVSLAAVVAGLAGYVLLQLTGGYSIDGFPWRSPLSGMLFSLLGLAVMGIVYLGALKLLRVRELDGLMAPIRARVGR
ncbi:murein biosynthesis integral membrane protein MurJ [Rothia sp. AR01]|uniref:Murein biosynthesis integral membrane protein MurJ n=1 Tax=Rothia santali TaxID=2949643 RepID=A0A9X2KH55_9MICC|nr:murein biosynthesis integral membrane protein MurJ [Rothia santali]MCP3425527.1 murein biosynthesis integral membrane protein MurJ [Rothia santali]